MIENETLWNDLIFRFLSNEADPLEEVELLKWLQSSERNKEYFNDMEKLWFASELRNNTQSYHGNEAYLHFESVVYERPQQKTLIRPVNMKAILRYAAVMMLGLLMGWYIWTDDGGDEQQELFVLTTPKGSRSEALLPDGSKVFLNTDSKLELLPDFGGKDRRVKLSGEAYFDVAKDKNRKFIVETGPLNIHVIGTKFNVNNYDNNERVELNLLEGAVEMENREARQVVKIEPNERAIFDKKKNWIDLEKTDAKQSIVWMKGELLFDSMFFKDIARILERNFDVEIIVHDDKLDKRMFYGEFDKSEKIEQILNVITADGRHYYEIKGRSIHIYKR